MKTPIISMLISARHNSKYLTKFLLNADSKTYDKKNTEVLLMVKEGDTWNEQLFENMLDNSDILLKQENYGMGRTGLHVYFNELATFAKGDWLVYFCDDHHIIEQDWDEYIRQEIANRKLDPNKIYCLVPTWDNTGSVGHIVSRGYYEALGYIGRNGWIDSYLNHVNAYLPNDRVIKLPRPIFHDFTADTPEPLTDNEQKPEVTNPQLPFNAPEVAKMIEQDADTLLRAIKGGK